MRPFATIFGLLEDIHISTNIPRKIARFARCKFWGLKMSNPEQSTTKFLPSWNFCKPCQSGGEERYAQGWSAGQETLKVKLALESRVFAASSQGHTAGRSATGLHMSPVKHRDVPQEVAKTVLWGPEASAIDLGNGRSGRLHTKSSDRTPSH